MARKLKRDFPFTIYHFPFVIREFRFEVQTVKLAFAPAERDVYSGNRTPKGTRSGGAKPDPIEGSSGKALHPSEAKQ
jgi:hypothetical protein